MTTRTHLVFVYGTLQRGERYHGLLARAELVAPFVTEAGFTLYDLGEYPGATRGGEGALSGELFSVDDDTLARLDELEEVPTLYVREAMPTPHGPAFVYLLADDPAAPVLASGDWRRRHDDRGGAPRRA